MPMPSMSDAIIRLALAQQATRLVTKFAECTVQEVLHKVHIHWMQLEHCGRVKSG
jgi:hypothetical protein